MYPHTASISRLQTAGTKYTFSPAGTSKCFLQPIDATSAQLFGITWSKGAVVFFPVDTDIKESDSLVIDGQKYGVRGVAVRGYGSKRIQHIKAIVEKV